MITNPEVQLSFESITRHQIFGHVLKRCLTTCRNSPGRTSNSSRRIPLTPRFTSKMLEIVSVRIGIAYRALGIDVSDGILWFWIGSHADYDRVIGD
jgi:hypothetical protein